MSKNKKIDDFFKKRSQEEVNKKSNDHESNLATENPNYEEPPFKVPRVEVSDQLYLERDPGKRKPIWEYQTSKEQNEIRKNFLQKEYSPTTNAAYCLPCFLYAKPSGRQRENAFTIEGFRSWNKVNGKDYHNSAHKYAVKKCNDLLRMEQYIDTLIDNITPEIIERNRLKLKVSIVAVRWLTFQHCAFRGHDESVGSLNRGNFLEFIQAIASFSKDVEKIVLENALGNASYTSHQIQQEILSIYSGRIRDVIRNEIGDQKYCIIVDETKDKRLFDLIHVKETNALYLKGAIEECLLAHKLNIENIRGQGYDGASNMRGEWSDLQALIQLALIAASRDVISVYQFFSKLKFNVNIIISSAKRRDQLQAAYYLAEIERLLELEKLETGKRKNQIGTTVIKEGKGEQRGEADKAYDNMISFEFVLVLHIMIHILGITNDLFQALQRKSQDILNAMHLVSNTTILIQKLRDDGQLDLFLLEIKEHPQLDSLKSISDLCQWLAETESGEIYYLIDRLVRLVLTLPVSTAIAERAFSAMKLIKIALRNHMEDDYLTDSLIVYVEKGIAKEFDIDSIIDEFASKKDRRSLLKISKTNK
ncbi:hypothetical protein RND81_09G030000 [Saponaria officinalis]|uniref:TTF-type domain-containing protein n=1 Tax=Saponaria officinalis TaxID=3572 RepID=A0AAW1II30_SAPOF